MAGVKTLATHVVPRLQAAAQVDDFFINDSESHMALEQKELLQKIEGLSPYVRLFGVGSGVMAVVVFGMWIWQGLNQN